MLRPAHRTIRRCPPPSEAFVDRLAGAFTDLISDAEDMLYVGGTAHLSWRAIYTTSLQINELMRPIESVASRLEGTALSIERVRCLCANWPRERIPAMRSLALVAASYGVAQLEAWRRVGNWSSAYGLRRRDQDRV